MDGRRTRRKKIPGVHHAEIETRFSKPKGGSQEILGLHEGDLR
jgi:hypothetical protein